MRWERSPPPIRAAPARSAWIGPTMRRAKNALADLNLRHHVPDQLQVDLGDAHAGIAARPGERDRHVGLGLAPEIYRPVIDLAGQRIDELAVLRVVDLAADHVHGEARHAQLL